MGWVIDVAAGILRNTGHKDLAEWLQNAPAKLGEEIGKILQEGLASRGTLSGEARAQLEKLQKSNPTPNSRPLATDVLDEYLQDVNALISLAAPLTTIALKGFFHDRQCLTVWHFDEKLAGSLAVDEPRLSGEQRRILFYGSGLDLFVLGAVDDDAVRQLNVEIEKNADDVLKDIASRYEHQVYSLTKNDLALAPRRARRGASAQNILPITHPEHIAECFRTLPIAKEAQSERLAKFRDQAKSWR